MTEKYGVVDVSYTCELPMLHVVPLDGSLHLCKQTHIKQTKSVWGGGMTI